LRRKCHLPGLDALGQYEQFFLLQQHCPPLCRVPADMDDLYNSYKMVVVLFSDELDFKFSRSSGPGGQNVNKGG